MTEEDRFIVDGMRWSFSRLTSFDQCPYAWKRTYIDCEPKVGNAFASYGTLMHKCNELYLKGELDIFDLCDYWEQHFDAEIPEEFPTNKYTDLREKYYNEGMEYLENIDLPIDDPTYEVIGVEKRVDFEIDSYPFVGFIDVLLRNKETGALTIFDHKSANLKFKKDGTVSKTDQGHFESFKKQLYLYSKPLIEAGEKVESLEWNLFRLRRYLKIPWIKEEYEAAVQWAADTIHTIEQESLWLPNPNYYFCNNLCDHRDWCEFKN